MKMRRRRITAVLLIISLLFSYSNVMVTHAEETNKTFTGEGYEIEVMPSSQWKDGYIAEVSVKNTSDKVIENWKLIANIKGNIEAVWNASITSETTDKRIITNAGWNSDIKPDSSVCFGIHVSGATFQEIQSVQLKKNKRKVKDDGYGVEYKLTSQWENHAIYDVIIHNSAEEEIHNWVLNCSLNATIDNIWNAEILEDTKPEYKIGYKEYNETIKSGESIQFGMQVTYASIEDIIPPMDNEVSCIVENEEENAEDSEGDTIYYDVKDRDWNRRMINADSDLVKEEKEKEHDIIRVALLDSGINFSDQVYVQERKNFVPGQDEYSPLYEDVSGHGTSIAEVLAANPDAQPLCDISLDEESECVSEYEDDAEDDKIKDETEDLLETLEEEGSDSSDGISLTELLDSGYENITGMNSDIELYSAKVLDENNETTVDRVVQAIKWAEEEEVDIISMSFGMEENSKELHKVIKDAEKKGILLIAAAGNEDRVEYPAAYDEVMAVGSVDSMGEKSEQSATGEEIEVVAPGEFIVSRGFFDSLMVFSGTSMAVPHVVGLATLLWQKDSSKSADFIRQLIDGTAKEYEDKKAYGYGLIDCEYALQNYDVYEKQYEAKKLDSYDIKEAVEIVEENTLIEENNKEIEQFQSIQKLYGSWGKKAHKGFVSKKNLKGINLEEITTILENANIFVDKKPDKKDKLTDTGVQGITYHPEFHGYMTTNYIASYLYLVQLAKQENKNGCLNLVDTSSNDKFSKNKELKKAYDAINKAFGDPNKIGIYKWEEISSLCKQTTQNGNTSIPKKYRSLVIYGMALHTITDVYAHSSYCWKKSKEEENAVTWRKLKHSNTVKKDKNSKAVKEADATFYCAKRYSNAKQVAKKVMSHIELNKNSVAYRNCSINDITGDGFYNINAKDGKNNYKYFSWNKNILKTSYLEKAYAIKGMKKYISQIEDLENTKYSKLKKKVEAFDLESIKDITNDYVIYRVKLKEKKNIKSLKIQVQTMEGKKKATIKAKKVTCKCAIKKGAECILQPYVNSSPTKKYYKVEKDGKISTLNNKNNKNNKKNTKVSVCSLTNAVSFTSLEEEEDTEEDPNKMCDIYDWDVDLGEWTTSCLKGKIYAADKDNNLSNNSAVKDAKITLQFLDSEEIEASSVTKTDGMYEVKNLPAGIYKMKVEKEGYQTTTQIVTIHQGESITNNIALELISGDYSGKGSAGGCVYDGATGEKVAGLTLYVRNGINNVDGEIVYTCTTNSLGQYHISDFPYGNYCVEIKDEREVEDRYFTSQFNIKILGGTVILNQNGVVINEIGEDQIRIVLTWGEQPDDLDSHLVGPNEDGSRFHMYYRNKIINGTDDGDAEFGDDTKVRLDVDDTDSYGPETTTIYDRDSGDYYYYIYNFSHKNSEQLMSSGAVVQVYYGNATLPVYTGYVPQQEGYFWNVFKIDGDTGEIVPINTVTYNEAYK